MHPSLVPRGRVDPASMTITKLALEELELTANRWDDTIIDFAARVGSTMAGFLITADETHASVRVLDEALVPTPRRAHPLELGLWAKMSHAYYRSALWIPSGQRGACFTHVAICTSSRVPS
jgi:hypothetical protein